MSNQPIPLSLYAPTNSLEIEKLVHEAYEFISHLSKKGGPDPSDYSMLNMLLQYFSGDIIIICCKDSFTSIELINVIQCWFTYSFLIIDGD